MLGLRVVDKLENYAMYTNQRHCVENPNIQTKCNVLTVPFITLASHRFPDVLHEVFQMQDQVKVKAVPLQAWIGPEGSRKLRLPDFMATAQDGDKIVSLTHQPHFLPGNTPGTHFC